MEMNLNRYEQITGREALGKLLEGERVFFKSYGEIHHYEISRNELLVTTSPSGYSYATLQSFLKEADTNWFIKKPFDVRAEMLARPSEWVGAYKWKDRWFKVRFNAEQMRAEESNLSKETVIAWVWSGGLDICIPIEDVPKEELT